MPVKEIVFDFIKEYEIPFAKVDSDIDLDEDMPFVDPSQKYFLMNTWNFCLNSKNMENRDSNVMREL